MKPVIDKERCAAQADICPPIKSCPQGAVFYVEDESAALGGRIEIDSIKCDGCGICVPLCCGRCMEMR